MGNIQLKAFRQFTDWRTGLMPFAGVLFESRPWVRGGGSPNTIFLGIIALIVAVAYFGTIVCHELYEINDQRAGRSPELKELPGKG